MRMNVLLLVFVGIFPLSAIGQSKSENARPDTSVAGEDNLIYAYAGIEEKPEFPGVHDALLAYIKKNVTAPESKTEGKTYVMFVVEKDGSLADIKILRGISQAVSDQIIKALKASPKWKPASQNGKTVRCSYALSIVFP